MTEASGKQFQTFYSLFPYRPNFSTNGFIENRRLTLSPHKEVVLKPYSWKYPPSSDRNWLFQYYSMRFLLPLIDHENANCREEAVKWINAWMALSDHDMAPLDRSWAPHTVAFRALVLTHAREKLGLDNLPGIQKHLKTHFDYLHSPEHQEFNNHGYAQCMAFFELTAMFDISEKSGKLITQGINRLCSIYRSNFSESGIHLEQSPFYHYYSVAWILKLCVYLSQPHFQGKVSPWFSVITPQLPKIARANGFLCDQKMILPPIGASDPIDISHLIKAFEKYASRAGLDQYFNSTIEEKKTLTDPHSGFAVFKERSTNGYGRYAVLKIQHNPAPPGKSQGVPSHAHNDALSLFFRVDGVDIFTDCGRFSNHKKDPNQQYVSSWFAHNTIGKFNCSAISPNLISHFRFNSTSSVSFSGELSTSNFFWRRTVEYPDRNIDLVRVGDSVEGNEGHRLRWHLGESLEWLDPCVTDQFLGVVIREKSGKYAIKIISNLKVQAKIVCGQRTPEYCGWASRKLGEFLPIKVLVVEPLEATEKRKWEIKSVVQKV